MLEVPSSFQSLLYLMTKDMEEHFLFVEKHLSEVFPEGRTFFCVSEDFRKQLNLCLPSSNSNAAFTTTNDHRIARI